MPNQRKSVRGASGGQEARPEMGQDIEKTRSTHDDYITLPVLFLMLSNHYPMTFSNPRAIPAIVTSIIVADAIIRYFYNILASRSRQGALVGLGSHAALAVLLRFRLRRDGFTQHARAMGLAALSARGTRADDRRRRRRWSTS